MAIFKKKTKAVKKAPVKKTVAPAKKPVKTKTKVSDHLHARVLTAEGFRRRHLNKSP